MLDLNSNDLSGQCNRCHVVPGLEPASARLSESCVTCHQAITAGRLDLW